MRPAALLDVCARMSKPQGILTSSGREAIHLVLKQLKLQRHDEVWILTTFDFPNVSSCVTSTIFNVCKPSRVLTEATRAIFVIHEFGVPCAEMRELRVIATSRGIPLIEDCAHTIDSRSADGNVGVHGDYAILSLPKIFAAAAGGVLLGASLGGVQASLNAAEQAKLENDLGSWLYSWPEQAARRREVYVELTSRFEAIGLSPLFKVTEAITPWFFPVPTPRHSELISRAQGRGVDCRLWHGAEMVVFPCHQFMSSQDIRRIVEIAAIPLHGHSGDVGGTQTTE